MVWRMVRVNTFIGMDQYKRVSGFMTSNMVMERSTGSTTLDMKANILEAKNMELVTRI